VFGEEEYPLCDIRIDDHDTPCRNWKGLFVLYPAIKVLPELLKNAIPPFRRSAHGRIPRLAIV